MTKTGMATLKYPLFTAFCLGVPVTHIPRLPPRLIKQQLADLEIGNGVEQRLLGTDVHFLARNRPLVSCGVVVHAVDLQQPRIRLVRRLCVSSDIAVLVDDGTSDAVWASARFPKDDLRQLLVMFGFPTCFGSQFRQPTDVPVLKNDWFYRGFDWFFGSAWFFDRV